MISGIWRACRSVKARISGTNQLNAIAVFLTAIALWGCSLPDSGVDSGGELKLLYAPFSLKTLPRFWHYDHDHTAHVEWQDKDARIALATYPGQGWFEIGRRTNIVVLASPYLSFDWQMNETAQAGDVEMVLGFRRVAPGNWSENDLGAGKPSMDQTIRLPIGDPSARPGVWQRDYYDLSIMYRRFWPDAPADEVRLVWISLRATPDHPIAPQSEVVLTHILLSR
ncbi:hypothetical protein LPB41_27845 [Thalassospira sp. MA62]|nr:hypothetical protein [Thalassospira sp. MA62]